MQINEGELAFIVVVDANFKRNYQIAFLKELKEAFFAFYSEDQWKNAGEFSLKDFIPQTKSLMVFLLPKNAYH